MRFRARTACVVAILSISLLGACRGKMQLGADTPGGANNQQASNVPGGSQPVTVNPEVAGVPTLTLRRLSVDEYDNTVKDLLGDDTKPAAGKLPEDAVDPFDNNGTTQRVSTALIESLETVATDVADRAMTDTARRDQIVGCSPTGPDDATCFEKFVRTFGRRAFRRPLTDEEVSQFMALQSYSTESGDFYEGAKLVIQAMLQMPDFVYHLQRGVPVDGRPNTYRLTQFEVASRLSYFLWGSMPDDTLLDAAANGELDTPEQVRAQAERMMKDPRTRTRIERFHAMWLGYYRFSIGGTLGDAMLSETNHLIDRVVFDDKRSYFDLFTLPESYLTDELADHYGVPEPGSTTGKWVDVSNEGRGGLFSEGTFLSVVAKFGDTSPTERGRLIRERLMCQPIDDPPVNLNVNTDMPPASTSTSNCKKDRYDAIQQNSGCAACHAQMDPIGMGLENYDQTGAYRTHDVDDASCTIDGDGEIVGLGNFNGPRELGQLLVGSTELESCVVKQLWQFAVGDVAGDTDAQTLTDLQKQFAADDHRFDKLILDVAGSESFLYRVEPAAQAGQ